MLLTQQQQYYLSCARSDVSSLSFSQTTCQLNERAQPPCQCLPFETSEMGDTHVYLMRSVAPTPRSGMAGTPLTNASPISYNVTDEW